MVLSPTIDWIAAASDAGRAGAALAAIAVRPPRRAMRVSDTENARSSRAAVATTEIESAPRLDARRGRALRRAASGARRAIWAAVGAEARARTAPG